MQGRLSSDKEIQEDCMAQYEEFTIDQGSDVTITLNLVNTDGSKKNPNWLFSIRQIKKNL